MSVSLGYYQVIAYLGIQYSCILNIVKYESVLWLIQVSNINSNKISRISVGIHLNVSSCHRVYKNCIKFRV